MTTTYNKLAVFCVNALPVLKPIENWDVEKGLEIAKSIEGSYGFYFKEMKKTETRKNGEYVVKVNIIKESGKYYFDGYIETINDVKTRLKIEDNKNDRLMLTLMDRSGWDKIVRGINLNWSKAFLPNDVLLEDNNGIPKNT